MSMESASSRCACSRSITTISHCNDLADTSRLLLVLHRCDFLSAVPPFLFGHLECLRLNLLDRQTFWLDSFPSQVLHQQFLPLYRCSGEEISSGFECARVW